VWRCAVPRHQVLDVPPVFRDPLALKIVRLAAAAIPREEGETGRINRQRRAFIAARQRFVEDDSPGWSQTAPTNTSSWARDSTHLRTGSVSRAAPLRSGSSRHAGLETAAPARAIRDARRAGRTFFEPSDLKARLREIGFSSVQDVDADALNGGISRLGRTASASRASAGSRTSRRGLKQAPLRDRSSRLE
jgi:hypothetical protein